MLRLFRLRRNMEETTTQNEKKTQPRTARPSTAVLAVSPSRGGSTGELRSRTSFTTADKKKQKNQVVDRTIGRRRPVQRELDLEPPNVWASASPTTRSAPPTRSGNFCRGSTQQHKRAKNIFGLKSRKLPRIILESDATAVGRLGLKVQARRSSTCAEHEHFRSQKEIRLRN